MKRQPVRSAVALARKHSRNFCSAEGRLLPESEAPLSRLPVSLRFGCNRQVPQGWSEKLRREAETEKTLMAVRKTKKGAALRRWFDEKWVDVRTGKPCGRKKGEKRGTPYCRPSKRVSSKTPKTAGEMSASEKRRKIREKKRLGQPAGKPRRVSPTRRRKK